MNNRRIFTVEVDQNNPKVKKYHTMYVLEDTGGGGGGGSQQDIDYIKSLIPEEASPTNQLADKNFIENKIPDEQAEKLQNLPNIVFVEDESQIPSTGTTNTLYMIMEE